MRILFSIGTIAFCVILLGMLSSEMSQADDYDYNFSLDLEVPGFDNLYQFSISPEGGDVSIFSDRKIILYNISDARITSQRTIEGVYIGGGAWVEDEIIVITYPIDETPPLPDQIIVLSPNDLSTISSHSPVANYITMCKASPSGDKLAVVTKKVIFVLNTTDYSVIYQCSDHTQAVRAIAWSRDGTNLASAGYHLYVHDLVKLESTKISSSQVMSDSLLWTKNGAVIYVLETTGSILLFNIPSKELIHTIPIASQMDSGAYNYEHDDICYAEGKALVILSTENYIKKETYQDAVNEIVQTTWDLHGFRLITIADDGVLRVYYDKNNLLYNQPPEITIDNPKHGETVEGSFSASGSIFDDNRVLSSFYRINNLNWRILESAESWSILILRSELVTGSNTLSIKASDGEKETIMSVFFNLQPDNPPNEPPTVEIQTPMNGTMVPDVFVVTGIATDDQEVRQVFVKTPLHDWVLVDGTTSWDNVIVAPEYQNEWFIIEAKSFDGTHESPIDRITVFIQVNSTPGNSMPTVEVVKPVENDEVMFELFCEGVTNDDSGAVTTFMTFDRMKWFEVGTDIYWQKTLPLDAYPPGSYRLSFLAFDGELKSDLVIINISLLEYIQPQVVIVTPTPDQLFIEELYISGRVREGYGDINQIDVRINGGQWFQLAGGREWGHTFNTSTLPEGTITIEVRAMDGYSTSVVETIATYHYFPPEVLLSKPIPKSVIQDNVEVSGSVTHGYGDSIMIEMRLNGGEWVSFNGSREWAYVLHADPELFGEILLEVRVHDDVAYSSIENVTIIRENTIAEPKSPFLLLLVVMIIVGVGLSYYYYRSSTA